VRRISRLDRDPPDRLDRPACQERPGGKIQLAVVAPGVVEVVFLDGAIGGGEVDCRVQGILVGEEGLEARGSRRIASN